MSDDKTGLPEYNDALMAMVTFVRDIARDDTLEDNGRGELHVQAQEVLADFILASLMKMALKNTERGASGGPGSKGDEPKRETMDELERKNPDGFRNPITKWRVVEISTGDYVHNQSFFNHNDAAGYCATLNANAGGPVYKIVEV